jgi:hypothetical protein
VSIEEQVGPPLFSKRKTATPLNIPDLGVSQAYKVGYEQKR